MADDPNALVTAVYNNAKLQGDSDQLAYQKAVAALQQSAQIAGAYGQSFGYYTDLNQVGANAPPAGTPTLQAGQLTGSIGYIPNYTGVNAGQTMANLSGQAQTAQGAAGLTGFYTAPAQSRWTPGTFLKIDPNTYDYGTYGDQLDYVLSSGQLQRVNLPQARAMGWNGDLSTLNSVPFQTVAQLEAAPPSQLPQQTLQSLQQYSGLNTAAINQALGQAGATGMYTAPAAITPPGTDLQGNKFSDLDQGTQQAYYASNGGDWQAAMTKWTNDSNANIRQWAQANGIPIPGQAGTPQETLQAQNQYFTQAQALAQMYGQYYAPGAPGQAYQPGVTGPQAGQTTQAAQEQAYSQWLRSQEEARAQWTAQQTAAQNYLTLLSNLRGPADYAIYQKVLGSTPQGMKDLVAAAAGQYVPGGGAVTGVQPQAANLNTLYQQATGQTGTGQQDLQTAQNTLVAPNQMAPQTWNSLTDSQRQMLLGVWESQGYTQQDAKDLFNQSLPRYATNAPSSGSFRLQ